jgi:uncharacterized protein YbjT (DUF2867 family)
MFVIFGATGKIGRATAQALRRRGEPVRVVLRDASRGRELVDWGCELVVADLTDSMAIGQAIAGADAVQVICPLDPRADDAAGTAQATVDAIVDGLRRTPPPSVLAISDYGAELDAGTGVTLIFHRLELQLRVLPSGITFVRSAEHMQNWGRQVPAAIKTGVLGSLHQPLTKRFPTVSAPDVGIIAAELIAAPMRTGSPRIVHVEGPQRYSALDVAATLSELAGREVVARELARSEWVPTLRRGGLSASYAELVAELFETHNEGRIDAEGAGEIRRGKTKLRDALAPLVPDDR